LIAPDISGLQPTIGFVLNAIQRANEPALIKHAFRAQLKEIVPKIPHAELEKFLLEYTPLLDTFTLSTVDMLKTIGEYGQFSLNSIPILFGLCCKTFSNVGAALGQAVADFLMEFAKRQLSTSFSFPSAIRSLFATLSGLSHGILNKNERIIYKLFSLSSKKVIQESLPLSPKSARALEGQIDAAIQDFAFKTNPHYGEEIFQSLLEIHEIGILIFPLVLKNLAGVKRVHRRIQLLNFVTKVLELPKGLDVLHSKGAEFNKAVLNLIGEDFLQNKDDEKRYMKGLVAINKWLVMIEKKRQVCGCLNCGDIRRKLGSVMGIAKDPVQSYCKQILGTLQKVEGQVHPKQRLFT
jgi:hypothetical protein